MRYALYYTPPPDHALTRVASRWLGRSAFSHNCDESSQASGCDQALTAEPRRYGFHATIKAPFRLREDRTAEELEAAVRSFCAKRPICPIGPLSVARVGNFFALVPSTGTPFSGGLASRAVGDLDEFRAPLNEAELQRHLRSDLDDVETTNLVLWGYPYVFDRFRFHMTLTGPVQASRREAVGEQLKAMFDPLLLAEDFYIDALTLFVQDNPGGDFLARTRFPLWTREQMKATG
ncbi:DUF1045 domain-containing protein [Phyllobacterium zundukense]|uniref:Phosphonate metabolism protein n=1 Tax=Phyllobacterium zundukense TaxID=1867719 RepID=A0A2N9VYM9_9HYPH|nr:DUF1045 domain-containing protein [Phyllobacterium zundukense]ATU95184.1 hypothetical protein BLM14_25940 [Phyllobacterium zundukense]PIO44597.1 hypothetical protein B5P45_12085 [Phyllobacterium zundukense]